MYGRLRLVIVLGARVVSDRQALSPPLVVPSFHGELRCAAVAALVQLQPRQPWQVIVSGGYNVGVRYTLRGDNNGVDGEQDERLLETPQLDFHDFARARVRGPSEAEVMKARLCERYGLIDGRDCLFVLEESSATTLENASMCHLLLSRWFAAKQAGTDDQPAGPLPEVGLVTNLYHMPRALEAFSAGLETTGLCRVRPVFAEDLAVTLPAALAPGGSDDWVADIVSFYRERLKEHEAWPIDQLQAILEAIRDGDVHRSVGELVPLAAVPRG